MALCILMLLASTFFTLLAFIIINLLILFLVKSRTTTVVSLIFSHLVLVLFFSISISSQNYFKEITLVLIIYSMVILFLISNDNLVHKEVPAHKSDSYKILLAKGVAGFLFFGFIFILVFSLSKNINQIAKNNLVKKDELQNEIVINPLKSPSYGAHIVVKKFHFEKNSPKNSLDKIESSYVRNDKKLAHLRDNLLDNFLLKRSSDMIILIVAICSILLLLSNKKNNKNNESL